MWSKRGLNLTSALLFPLQPPPHNTTKYQVEYLLRDYLAVDEDVTSQTLNTAPISYVAAKNDMSVFFARSGRRPEKVQSSLFSFESSATGECF